jgi:transcriptional regulator with XRE-family HTH domain
MFNPLICANGHAQAGRGKCQADQAEEKKSLTQEQLADISGFSQQYISGLERGQRNPTVVTVYELASALGANYLDLMQPPPRGKR